MNALTDPFKQLVERRLWPVALLLIAALVAVPLLLVKKDSGSDVIPSATASVPAGQSPTQSIVSESDATKRDRARSVLGDRKDPFRPAQLHRVPKVKTPSAGTALNTRTPAGATGGANPGGGTAPPPTTGPLPTAPVTPLTPKPTFELYSLQVRVGDPAAELKTRNLKRLTGLPGGSNPALLYIGLLADHKSAVFIVDAGATVIGDGHCAPEPGNCQTLTLKPGQTVFVTRGAKQYEVDLLKINTKKTADARAAAASRKAVASGGRKALRARISRIGAYRYSSSSGTLHKLSAKAQAARVLKSAFAGLDGFTSTG